MPRSCAANGTAQVNFTLKDFESRRTGSFTHLANCKQPHRTPTLWISSIMYQMTTTHHIVFELDELFCLLAAMYKPVRFTLELGTLTNTSSTELHLDTHTDGDHTCPASFPCHCMEYLSSLVGSSRTTCGKKCGVKKEGKFEGSFTALRSTCLESKSCAAQEALPTNCHYDFNQRLALKIFQLR